MKDVHKKDNGQSATNVHIIAKRHILSGLPTNVTSINTVLSLSFTQQELDILTSIKPIEFKLSSDVKLVRADIQKIVGRSAHKSEIVSLFRIAGVYVFTNLKTGQQYVGSSQNLAERLITHFSPKNLSKGTQLIYQDFRKFTLSDYKIQIYIIKYGFDLSDRQKVVDITLVLEQYYIFTLNSKLNKAKVAGTPPFDDGILTPGREAIYLKQSKTVYVYINDILIYQSSSGVVLTYVSGISRPSINKGLSGSLIYGVLKFSRILVENCAVNLLSSSEFTDLVSNLRVSSQKESIATIALNENNKIAVHATNILTGQIYTAPSIRDISILLTTLGPKEYVSHVTIGRCLLNGKSTKRWTFKKNHDE